MNLSDVLKLREMFEPMNQQVRDAGGAVNQALGGYPYQVLDAAGKIAEVPGAELFMPAVALNKFPGMTVRGGLKELFEKLRTLKYQAEMGWFQGGREASLQEFKNLITRYTPGFKGVYGGSSEMVDKLPNYVESLADVQSRLIHPKKLGVAGSMDSVGGLTIYPGSQSHLGHTSREVREATKLLHLHESIHDVQFGRGTAGPTIRIPDASGKFSNYRGPMAEMLRDEVPPAAELLPWFMREFEHLPLDKIKYLADPSEVMARGISSKLYRRLFGYDKIPSVPNQQYHFYSWPQDLASLWSRGADMYLKLFR